MADELTTPRSRYRGLRRFGSVIQTDSGEFKPEKSIILGMDVDEMTIVCHITWVDKKSHLKSIHTTIPNHIGGFEKLWEVIQRDVPSELLSLVLNKGEKIIAVLESTAGYSQPFIQYFKDDPKFLIHLINPGKQPKRAKSDNKTDDRDSIDIATKARIGGFNKFHVYSIKSEAALVMQMLGRRPGYLVNKRVSYIQSIQAELVYYGITAHTSCSTKKDGTLGDSSSKSTRAGIWHSKAGLLSIEYLSNRCQEDGVLLNDDIYVCGEMLNFTPEDTRIHLMPFKNIPGILLYYLKEGIGYLREMDQQIKNLENLLMDTMECYFVREYEILSSCPGFGKIGPLNFIGETGEKDYYLSKYTNVSSALNNAGLGSLFDITGGKKKGEKKVLGNPRIKQVFQIAATSVIRNKSYTEDQERLKVWARSKWREKGWKQAVHILGRKLCLAVWHAYRTDSLVKIEGYALREGSQKKKKAKLGFKKL